MNAEQHFREAAYWIAKAPPFPIASGVPQLVEQTVVIRFPVERARQGQR